MMLLKKFLKSIQKKNIEYINMPLDIIDGYQNYTKANISKLRKAGYKKFISVYQGAKRYKS